jgi:hypothetical protein
MSSPANQPLSAEVLRRAVRLPLILALLFNFFAFLPELTVRAPDLNDHVLHYALISRINDVWQAGGNPRDPWIPYWGQGFPLLRYYQHLPHLTVAFVYRLLRGWVPLYDLFKGFHFALLVLIPLAFYLGARLIGFEPLAASFAALCTAVLAADRGQRYFMGFQALSFTWSGYGLYPQLWGMTLFAPAVGALHRTVLNRRRLGLAVALLSGLWLSHLVLGYIACVLGLLVLLRPEAGGRRIGASVKLAAIYLATLGVASFMILPTLIESRFINRSIWESPDYWDSLGLPRVLAALLQGKLLDGSGLPILSLLTLAGLALTLSGLKWIHKMTEPGAAKATAWAFGVALLIYFGRPTWGFILKLLPFSDFLPLHRWICGVQYASVLLAGLALSFLWELMRWQSSRRRLALASLLTLVILGPALARQWQSAAQDTTARRESAAELSSGGRGLEELLDQVHRRDLQRPGRAYAGTSWDWGRDYKLAAAPVSMYWSAKDISSISYMFHTMGRNSDLEVEFDPKRKDHFDLFNVRYLFHYDRSRLPPFAEIFADRPGIYAAEVNTPGYFETVGADLFYSAPDANSPGLLELNRAFIRGPLHQRGRFIRIGVDPADRPATKETAVARAEELEALAAAPWKRPRGVILSSWGHNDWFGAELRVEDPAYVLFRMTYHPNWRILLDRKPVAAVMLSPSFIGIPIQPGSHRLELSYRSRDWTVLLFYLGLALVGLILIGDRLRWWPASGSHDQSRSSRRRVLFEAGAALLLALLAAALAGLTIPPERMPHPTSERWRLKTLEQHPN